MNRQEILSAVDHTNLDVCAGWEQIRKLCDEAIRYHTASVCIAPSFVKQAADYVDGNIKICTVVGFPNGYASTSVKCFEAAQAVADGADEIDMVVHLGWVKEKQYDLVTEEIKQVKRMCSGRVLKVIIETCLLTVEEKIRMCEVVCKAGADYIKTSTGFSKTGATFEDVVLLKQNVLPSVKVKAAGGIRTFADAQKFLELGASRLGTSTLIKQIEREREK